MKSGLATDIAVGADGSVWIIGSNSVPGGYDIYKWNGSGWNKIDGGALRIAVDPAGNPWVVNSTRTVFKRTASGWQVMPGNLLDIAIGADGSIWGTAPDGKIMQFVNNTWVVKTGGATNIAVSPNGEPCVVNSGGGTYRSGTLSTAPVTAAVTTTVPATSGLIPYTPPSKTSGKVTFINTGNLPVKLYRTTSDNQKIEVTEIAGNSDIEVDAKLGEGFTVDIIGQELVTHRKIYVVDLDQSIFISGNVAMKDFAGYGVNFSQLNIDPNLYGVDTAVFNTKNLVTSMNKGQIFERLDVSRGIDYETDNPYLVKTGFDYASMNLGVSTNKTRMSYGYSSFSSGWNIAASGSFPVKAVDVSGGFGYGETQSNQNASTDVYTYKRHQVLTHQVSIIPSRAYLDPRFIDRVRRITDLNSAIQFVNDYGTHFTEIVYYGGDLSGYMRMSSTEYIKAKSMNLDVHAAVEKSTPTQTKSYGYKTEKSAGSTYGGKMNFSYNENQEQRSLLENTESQVKVIGGEYNGDTYTVNEGNASPLATSLRRIDELIDPKVFKDGTDPAHLFKARQLIKQAIDRHIAAKVPNTKPVPLPPPNNYVVTLTKMAVTNHLDDANANTKGKVLAAVFSSSAMGTSHIKHHNEKLWEQNDYSLDFRFSPNFSRDFNSKLRFTQLPDPATGTFKPFFLNLYAEVREKDDILWAPDGGLMAANSGPIDLNALNLQPGGPAATRSLDISAGGTGSIRVTYTIQKEENEFMLPGALDLYSVSTNTQGATQAPAPANEVEITMINGGGYAAKFEVDYTIDGYAKSYNSGDVPLGWKYKLALPPNAQNIKVKGFYHNISWKSIFDESVPSGTDKCFKVYGTIFNAAKNNNCN